MLTPYFDSISDSMTWHAQGRKLGFRVESGSKNDFSGEERKKGKTRSKGERKKGERKKGERRKDKGRKEKTKREDEERRRREKTKGEDVPARFRAFFRLHCWILVREKREKGKERKKGKTQSKGERKKGEYVYCSESKKTKGEDEERRRREKTKGEDVRRYVRVFLRLHCWIQLRSS
ncbi:hypothetical protein DEO72_LG3g1292 [Vigna unguiculata]|uniref:Uncharacterized protein n=1 Tax=Vigna unguiculata TaxID=3917 RepID=A0A4D6LEC4_VIGUN|nr:hypothetical protein DEO72_LG3g1292 [Vigna unguiculata]